MRTRWTGTCAVLALSLATAAFSAERPRFSVVGLPGLDGPAAAALDALNAASDVPFSPIAYRPERALSLYGGRFLASPDPVENAREFWRRAAPVFGIDPGWETDVRSVAARRIHVAFRAGGLEIHGVEARIVLASSGAVIGAKASAPPGTTVDPTFDIAPDEAASLARSAVERERARLGRSTAADFSVRTDAVLLPSGGGLAAGYRVHFSGGAAGESYRVLVDGRSGGIARIEDVVLRGTGFYPINGFPLSGGLLLPFKTKSGKMSAYKNVDHALLGIATGKKIKHWSKGVPPPVDFPAGLPISARADIWDANDDYGTPSGAGLIFDPTFQKDYFDQSNTLYQIESFYAYLKKKLGPLASNFSLPIVVNVDTNVPNAFFDPSLFPDGHSLGFLQFNDLEDLTGLGPAHDFSRDPTVVAHEYVHALLFYEGLGFGDPLNWPPRAVGEAIPDFFAVTRFQDTVIGEYLDLHFQTILGPLSRDLQDDDHFPETTLDAMTLTGDGLPEEHRNGEIFGSLLVDLRQVIGAKNSLKRVFFGLPFAPATMDDIAFPTPVTPSNAVDATGAFFGAVVLGLLQGDIKGKNIGEMIGAATARGVVGTDDSVFNIIVELETFQKRKETYRSHFLPGETTHFYLFRADQGRKVRVKVEGLKSGLVLPDFLVYDDTGDLGAVTHTKPKKVTKGGRVVEEKGILLNLDLFAQPAKYYVVEIDNAGGAGGYKLTIDA